MVGRRGGRTVPGRLLASCAAPTAAARGAHIVAGHLAGFVARLSFILASSTFAVMFFVRFEQLSLPPHRILMVLALLFSLFCYTLELERLARAIQGAEGR